MSAKHTPGPWRAATGACGTRVGVLGIEATPVAMLGIASALNPADVAMIEAAPDLYDALKTLLALPCVSVVEEAAREYPHGLDVVADEIAAFDAARAAIAKAERAS